MNGINLNELTLENVGQWPFIVKICVYIGVSLLIIALGYWLIIEDNFTQYSKLQGQETTLKSDFENKQRQLFNLPAYRVQLQVMKEKFALMLKQLPEKTKCLDYWRKFPKLGSLQA